MADLTVGEHIFESTTTQDLSAGALDFTTTLGTDFRLVSIFIHSTIAISQTMTVTVDALAGVGFDTVIGKKTFISKSDIQFVPAAVNQDFADGNEIRVQMTNSGTPAATVSVTVVSTQI